MKKMLVLMLLCLVVVGCSEGLAQGVESPRGCYATAIGRYNVRSDPDWTANNILWVTKTEQKLEVAGLWNTENQGLWLKVYSPKEGWISLRGVSIGSRDLRSLPRVSP